VEGQEEPQECGEVIKVDVDLTKLKVATPDGHNRKIMITDTIGMMMRYPSFSIIKKIKEDGGENNLSTILSCIDSVFDGDVVNTRNDFTEKELETFIEQLPRSVLVSIKEFFDTMPTMKEVVEMTCPKCGNKDKITLEGMTDFFT